MERGEMGSERGTRGRRDGPDEGRDKVKGAVWRGGHEGSVDFNGRGMREGE